MKMYDCFAFLKGFLIVPIIMFLVGGFIYTFFVHPDLARLILGIIVIMFFFILSCVFGLGSLKSSRLKKDVE